VCGGEGRACDVFQVEGERLEWEEDGDGVRLLLLLLCRGLERFSWLVEEEVPRCRFSL
jgi:hypothetical protein